MEPTWLPKGLQNDSKIALKKRPENDQENTSPGGHRPDPGGKVPAPTLIRIYVDITHRELQSSIYTL